ncbi:LPXTG cell wall anchor domain-containing protein [Stackebrandtia endophytica]|uniref:LPXTG cell wall anchor domain-containing protein n=1 Tax=Stackebrandtia endophytica TaxID=1496996 RepID=UPI001153B95F
MWTLHNQAPDDTAVIDDLETSVDSVVTGDLVEGATLPASDTTSLTGRQTVPSDIDTATLTVTTTWSDGRSETVVSDAVARPVDGCSPATEPDVEVLHTCVGLSITVTNPDNGPEGELFLAPSEGDSILIAIEPGSIETVEFLAPPDAADFSIEVTGSVTDTIRWRKPDDCPPVSLDVVTDCQGLTFTVVNPRDADRASVRFTPTVGQAQTVTVDPGGSARVGFSGDGTDFEVAVTSGDYAETFDWGSPSDCRRLPTTGGSLTGWVATGAAAVLLGSGMIVLLRRRRATW